MSLLLDYIFKVHLTLHFQIGHRTINLTRSNPKDFDIRINPFSKHSEVHSNLLDRPVEVHFKISIHDVQISCRRKAEYRPEAREMEYHSKCILVEHPGF